MSTTPKIRSVSFDVYGNYSHGVLKGKVNPKSVVRLTLNALSSGDTVKDICNRLTSMTDGAFYRIAGVSSVEA